MTVKECLAQAYRLLGYTDTVGSALQKQAVGLADQIAAELWYAATDAAYIPLTSPAQVVPLPDQTVRTVLPYGVAMLIAQVQGDADNQAVFAALYDGRRSLACQQSGRVEDRLPEVSE